MAAAVGVQLYQPAVLGAGAVGAGFAGDDIAAVAGQGYGVGEFVGGAAQGYAPFLAGLGQGRGGGGRCQ